MSSPKTVLFLLIASIWSLCADFVTPSTPAQEAAAEAVHFQNNDEQLPVGLRSSFVDSTVQRSEDADLTELTQEIYASTNVFHTSLSAFQLSELKRISLQLTSQCHLEVLLLKLII